MLCPLREQDWSTLKKKLQRIDVGYIHLYIKLYAKALISAPNENSWIKLVFLESPYSKVTNIHSNP